MADWRTGPARDIERRTAFHWQRDQALIGLKRAVRGEHGQVRVEVDPLADGLKYWDALT